MVRAGPRGDAVPAACGADCGALRFARRALRILPAAVTNLSSPPCLSSAYPACALCRMREMRCSKVPTPRGYPFQRLDQVPGRSEEHTSELQSRSDLVCRLLLEKKK